MDIRKKRMILCISNAGSEGKTTLAKAIKEMLIHNGISHSTLLGDKDHIELLKTYGASEVKMFDIRQDKDTLINALADDVEVILVDFPASSIDEVVRTFGSMEEFVSALSQFNTVPTFATPVVSDKSIQSIDRLIMLCKGIQDNYEYLFVLNEGLMAANKDAVTHAFNSNKAIAAVIESGKAQTATLKVKFTPTLAEIVRTKKLREALKEDMKPMERILLTSFLRETETQFSKVLGINSVTQPTKLETWVKEETKKK